MTADPITIACNLCQSRDAEPVRHRDRHGKPLRAVICRQCGLVWTDPRPSAEQVREFYRSQYRVEYKGIFEPQRKHTLRAGRAALERLGRLTSLLRPGARLLDVGAGGGDVVYLARAMGYDASGFEPNQGYADHAARVLKVPVTQGVYQDARIPAASQDAVTLFHTAEHLDDPFDAMTTVREWLVPGGLLVIEVPSVEATCQQPHQQFHRGHLYHFNLVTLEQMGRCAGYTVVTSGTSPDGGNIWVVYRRSEDPPAPRAGIPGNYQRVRRILDGHTSLTHAFSRYPYTRPAQKLLQRIREWAFIRRYASSAEVLAALAPRRA